VRYGIRSLISASIPIISLLILTLTTSLTASASSNYVFYIYGSLKCGSCASLVNFFKDEGLNYYFCSFENMSCATRFSSLVEGYGVPDITPLTLVIVNDSVVAIVGGDVHNKDFWLGLLSKNYGGKIPIYLFTMGKGFIEGVDSKVFAAKYAPEVVKVSNVTETTNGFKGDLWAVVAVMFGLALSDAINPCATYVYILLLVASALVAVKRGSKGLIMATGTAFICAVYVGYYMLGVGLLSVLTYVPTWVLSAIAIGFGLWVIITGIFRKSRIVAKSSIINLIRRAKTSVIMSVVLGFVVTFTLLPCSSGPYVVFAGLISRFNLVTALTLLALYNLLFILPLVVIMFIITTTMKYRRVQEFIVTYDRPLSVVAGILLIGVGIYVLLLH